MRFFIIMYQVLLVSENRFLLKKVFSFIEKIPHLSIHVIPFSMDTCDYFFRCHADIVIIDRTVFLPYKNIIENFKASTWNYAVILLPDEKEVTQENICAVVNEKITTLSKMNRKTEKITINWNGIHTFNYVSDICDLIYIYSSTILNLNIVENLKNKLENKAGISLIFQTESEMLFSINHNQEEHKSLFPAERLETFIFETLGNQSFIIFEKNILPEMFVDKCKQIKWWCSYSYFLRGRCLRLSDVMAIRQEFNIDIIKSQFYLLVSKIVYGKMKDAEHILQELYLHTVKLSFCFETRNCVHLLIEFLLYLVCETEIKQNVSSAENEYLSVLKSGLFLFQSEISNKNREICINTVREIIETVQQGISLENIAVHIGYNKIYISRLFKKLFGITILDSVQFLRILYAKYYLSYTDKTVSETAELSGFNDVSYFCKFFHVKTGMTADEYRRKNDESPLAI